MRERGVPMPIAHYAGMLDGLLQGIEDHADARVAGEFFPAYLQRCIANHWQHHWEEYYNVGKQLRGTIDRLVARCGVRAGAEEDDATAILAAANALVATRATKGKGSEGVGEKAGDGGQRTQGQDPQLDLFGG